MWLRETLQRGATWDSVATASDEHEADEPFHVFELSHHRDLLKSGTNILSVHMMNDHRDSSDLLMQPALVAYPAAPAVEPARPLAPWQAAFLEWRGQFFGQQDFLSPELAIVDSDDDGFSDLVEFAVNSPPDNGSIHPELAVAVAGSGVRLTVTLRFPRRKDAASLGLKYVLEQSRILQSRNANPTWTPVDLGALAQQGAASVSVHPMDDPSLERVEIRFAHDSRATPSQYYRLRIEFEETM